MTWKQYIFPNQCSPALFDVWKCDHEIYFSGPCIASDCETEAKFWGLFDVSFLERPFVVHCDFVIMTEEVGNTL